MSSQSLDVSPASTSPPSPAHNTPPVNPSAPPTSIGSPPPPSQTNGRIYPQPAPSRNSSTLVALGVGIGIGGAFVLVGVCIFVFWYRRRKKRLGMMRLSVPPPSSQKHKDDLFGGLRQHWQQSAPSPTDSMVSMLPKPSPPPGSVSNSQQLLVGVHTSLPLPSFSTSSGSEKPQPLPGVGMSFSQVIFSYEELKQATDGFSEGNLLGQGGFGYVHKGVLPDGKEVAVKQLKIGSGQGEREFRAEVEIIGRVHHRHLVSLVGYCCSGAQRLLVYEFVPNKTLEFHLHGVSRAAQITTFGKGPLLTWATRMKIALGSARGLAYLHDCHPKIIHRDIKASNILLDHTFEAKLADFGLARLNFDTDTHISTRVMGTFGYLAPEYALTGKLTDKSDVFSFGVMLLELITGRRPIDKAELYLDDNIVDWARPLLNQAVEDGNFDTLVDARLQKDYDSTEMARMVSCAAVCVHHLARLRPRMSQVVRALEGNISLDELNEGCEPGHSRMHGSHGSSDSEFDNSQYRENLKKFSKIALETQSSEFSGPTSEFGVHISGSSSEGLQTTQETALSIGGK